MSKFIFIYGLFYAFNCFGAVNAHDASLSVVSPISPSTTRMSTETATATATSPATTPLVPATAQVPFSDGSFALGPSGVQNIRLALREAELRGKIAEVRVLAWGDQSTVGGQTAPAAEVNLANQRGQAVAGFIRASNPAVSVATVNVPQNPTALQTLLADPALSARGALGNVGVYNPGTSTKHSVAVVLVIVH